MNHLLTGLLLDLLARSRRLQALVSENLHPQLHDHRQQALDWLTKEENQLTTLLADPTLLDPKIIQTHYTQYRKSHTETGKMDKILNSWQTKELMLERSKK